jgi:hypothetical protein
VSGDKLYVSVGPYVWCVCRSVNFPALTLTADELVFHTQQIAMARGIPLGEVCILFFSSSHICMVKQDTLGERVCRKGRLRLSW